MYYRKKRNGKRRIRINGIRRREGHSWRENGAYHELRFFYCPICKRDHAYDQDFFGKYFLAGEYVGKNRIGGGDYCPEHYPDAECKLCRYIYKKIELIDGICPDCINAKKEGEKIRPFSEVETERVYCNLP